MGPTVSKLPKLSDHRTVHFISEFPFYRGASSFRALELFEFPLFASVLSICWQAPPPHGLFTLLPDHPGTIILLGCTGGVGGRDGRDYCVEMAESTTIRKATAFRTSELLGFRPTSKGSSVGKDAQ